MNYRLTALCLSLLLSPASLEAQTAPSELLEIGLQQLDVARATPSNPAFTAAEDTFSKLLSFDPDSARALIHRGEARIAGGILALRTSLGVAIQLFQSGIADMDQAVSHDPDALTVRVTRGLTFIELPAYYNKQSVAREDLEAAIRHSAFAGLPTPLRDRVVKALERVGTALSPSAIGARPDRFPGISQNTSPIMAVASITFQSVRPSERPLWLQEMTEGISQSRGLLGMHGATSFDHPGMFLIFTWWQNKQALNDFYYSDLHQSWMRRRGGALTGRLTMQWESVPFQVGIELFTSLPGGLTRGGGFVPKEVAK